MTPSRVVELEGHIIDSGMMGSSFGIIMDHGGSFDVGTFVPILAERLLE